LRFFSWVLAIYLSQVSGKAKILHEKKHVLAEKKMKCIRFFGGFSFENCAPFAKSFFPFFLLEKKEGKENSMNG